MKRDDDAYWLVVTILVTFALACIGAWLLGGIH
jgi:hypothetical protein